MLDTATTIGRSCVHLDGDSTDTGGATVGVAGTNVSDSSFALVPTGDFTEGPGGTREVHTELRSMNLVADACPALCTGTGNGVPITVRAGVGTGVALATVGEVETLPGGGDFPAESFFDVFVEIDTPFFGGTTLANSASNPLLVVDPALDALPPKVVYIHGETNAVPVSFVDGPSAGQVFGYLRLAGHGAGFVANCGDNEFFCVDVVDFAAQLAAAPLMPCPQCIATPVPATGVTAKIVLVLVATAGLLFVVRSRGPAQA